MSDPSAIDLWTIFRNEMFAELPTMSHETAHMAAAAFWGGLLAGLSVHNQYSPETIAVIRAEVENHMVRTLACVETNPPPVRQ